MKIKRNSGFTLIELLIVIAILGIVLLIAAPAFQTYMTSSRLKGAARQVMSDLMSARMQAVSRNNNFRLVFSADGKQYTIVDDKNNNAAADTGETTVTKNIQTNYHDVSFSATNDLSYTPRGATDLTTTATITLTNSSGKKSVCVASPGRVKMVAGDTCS